MVVASLAPRRSSVSIARMGLARLGISSKNCSILAFGFHPQSSTRWVNGSVSQSLVIVSVEDGDTRDTNTIPAEG